MVVITLGDVIGIILGSIIVKSFILFFVISYITNKYKEKSKKWHNCFDCKNYYCRDISSVGGISYDKCKITGIEDIHEFNDDIEYRKCKDFTKKQK